MGITEIVIVLAVALIVLGPERLPEVLKTAGKVLRELRAASNTVMRELTEATEEPRRTFRDLDPFKPDDKPKEPPKQA